MKKIFYVNEAKRTVVCVFDDCAYDVMDSINRMVKKTWPTSYISLGFSYKTFDKFVAKAVCSPNDVFDVNVGKAIAEARCEVKYLKECYRHCAEFLDGVYDLRDRVLAETAKITHRKLIQLPKRLQELTQ